MGISYQQVPQSSRFFLDYVHHFERVAEFYTVSPFEIASYKQLASKLSLSAGTRQVLCDVLLRQNTAFQSPQGVLENIQLLRSEGTFAVVTGQQVGLFSGPAFTLYKALTAVKTAQWLSENGLPSVPVFWLATEDHDLAEVSQASVFDAEYELVPLACDGDRPAPHSPAGEVKLPPAVTDVLNLLESSLAEGTGRGNVLRDLRDTYQPGVSFGHAFAQFMARLFGRWGVVLVDSLDPELHRLSAATYSRALDEADPLRKRLLQRSAALESRGYHSQVHIADNSTLLFLIRAGNRQALHQRGGSFQAGEGEPVSTQALQQELRQDPLSLSGNVLMRPIIQDTLLPTLAYVAGPSELAYLGQAQAVYEDFGRPMPIVVPRAAFTLVDARTQRMLDKYRISVVDVWQGEEGLGLKIAAAGFAEGWDHRFDTAEQEITRLLSALAADIEALDPTLLDPLKGTTEKMKQQLQKLRAKLSRAALQRSDLLSKHQRALLQFLYPARHLQERQVSGIYFLSRAGYEILDRILDDIQVTSPQHQVLQY